MSRLLPVTIAAIVFTIVASGIIIVWHEMSQLH